MSTVDVAATLEGLWVPIVTPFGPDEAVDHGSLERLGRHLLAAGAAGLVALGTTGEPATLEPEERRAVVETCDRVCREAGRGLLVGAGTNSTRGTIAEIERLTAGTSAAAALVVVPYYTRPSEPAIVEHFAAVADASPLPLVAYNVPHRTGRGLGAEALLALADHPRIVGLKQAVGALDADTLAVLARGGPDFRVLAGDDAFIAPTLLMGGAGAISASAHICTALFVGLAACGRAGDHLRARELGAALLPLVGAGFAEPSPAVWKGVLARTGLIDHGGLRRPMTPASLGAVDRLAGLVARAEATQPRTVGSAPMHAGAASPGS